jgi:predicted transcriptional regulator
VPEQLPRLADAELAVMQLLWDHEQMTAREIRERLYPDDSTSYHGTVQKLLERLQAKGYVTRDRSQFVHLFRSKISRREYAGRQLESLADKLTDGSLVPFLTHLMEARKISAKQRREIRDLLDRHK